MARAPAATNAAPSLFPRDPLYFDQWHLLRLGNLPAIWGEYTGAGVSVGLYGSGVQSRHPDLAGRYDDSLHVVIDGQVLDGNPAAGGSGSGTSEAGLIAARADGSGPVGVAFGATVTGIDVADPASPIYWDGPPLGGFQSALRQAARFDVVTNHWGDAPRYLPSQSLAVDGSAAQQALSAWYEAAAGGRNGLGTVIVKGVGDHGRDGQGDGLNATRLTVTVASVDAAGLAAAGSNHGAMVLVSAPGGDLPGGAGPGLVTTDLLGTAGYNLAASPSQASDHTDRFGGTAASAAIVTGVVALMLDAAPRLGWRDVHDILALSARHTGAAIGAAEPAATEDGVWAFNGSSHWNGGGMHVHPNYGYGTVDAHAAVRMAEVWSLFTPVPQASDNEAVVTTVLPGLSVPIADLSSNEIAFIVGSTLSIEHVALTLTLGHSYYTDLRIALVSPQGTRIALTDGTAGNGATATDGFTWTFGIESLRGELSSGMWTLQVDDVSPGDGGQLDAIELAVHGRPLTPDEVFHFTDEFAALAGGPGGDARRLVADTKGGSDWINASAVTSASFISLQPGAFSSVDGSFFRIAPGSIIENAIGGDGNDDLLGNAAANQLYGMRGADRMVGRGGNDTYQVDDPGDIVVESEPDPRIGGVDTVISQLRSYTLPSFVEVLRLSGRGALDGTGNALSNLLVASSGDNRFDGRGGIDTVSYEAATRGVRVDLAVAGAQATGGSGRDSFVNIENLVGTAFGDVLAGNGVANTLTGGGGRDRLTGGGGVDSFVFDDPSAVDVVTDFRSGVDRLRFRQSEIAVGDGDTRVERGVAVAGPGGFSTLAELVIVAADMTDVIGARAASRVIGSATGDYAIGQTVLFAVDDGSSSAVFLFRAQDADPVVSAGELTQLISLEGVPSLAIGDFFFG